MGSGDPARGPADRRGPPNVVGVFVNVVEVVVMGGSRLLRPLMVHPLIVSVLLSPRRTARRRQRATAPAPRVP